MPFTQGLPTNYAAMLDLVAWSEIGPALLAESDDGYNILCGSTPGHPLLFPSYADHPRILNRDLDSTAAGRGQIIARMYDAYKLRLSLPDFSPASQDAICLQMMRERGALALLDAGNIRGAILTCAPIWASFPGNTYGQPTHSFTDLEETFVEAGGVISVLA
jgi:muramidase (phage lysozyme)